MTEPSQPLLEVQKDTKVIKEDDDDDDQMLESDTEDEEVKRNCILGHSGLRDSDFFDTDDDEDEEEKPAAATTTAAFTKEESGPEDVSLVQFVPNGHRISKGLFLYRPTPVAAASKLPTHLEEEKSDDEEQVEDSVSSHSESSQEEEEERALENEEEALLAATASNQGLDSSESEEESESDEDDSDHQDEPDTEPDSALVLSRPPLSHSVSDQQRFDDDSVSSEDGIEASVHEQEYASVILEPAAISDESDETMAHHDPTEPEEEDYALIGATVDDKWTWTRHKRVLSSNTLASLNQETRHNADSPKRARSDESSADDDPAPTMPELTLGAPVFEQTYLLPHFDIIRDDSPLLSSDEEEDRVLSEELEENMRDAGGDNSPIPLLTPPQSPRRDDDVEWPSNLVIDSALMNTVSELRSLSPASLQNVEEEEEHRLRSHDTEASTLTPLLRSIYVGMT